MFLITAAKELKTCLFKLCYISKRLCLNSRETRQYNLRKNFTLYYFYLLKEKIPRVTRVNYPGSTVEGHGELGTYFLPLLSGVFHQSY